MKKFIYFIRHPETNSNKKAFIAGSINDDLNENGYEQANLCVKDLKKKLHANEYFQNDIIIYSSDALRCSRLAILIQKEFKVDRDTQKLSVLREINAGLFRNKKWGLKETKDIKYWLFNQFPDGESYSEVFIRAKHFISEILQKNNNEIQIVVSHGGFIGACLSIIDGLDINDFPHYKIRNCEIIMRSI